MSKDPQPFHAVRHTHNDEFQTYSIYVNNREYLKPVKPFLLGRREAYAITKLLNTGKADWSKDNG